MIKSRYVIILADDFKLYIFLVGSITRMDHRMDRDGVHVLLCICVVALMLMTIPLYIDGPRKFGSSVTNCELV